MSEHFTLSLSQERATELCRACFPPTHYRWLHDHGWAFLVKEHLSLVNRFLTYPVKFAIAVREESPRKATVELHAATFGWGPIPNRLLRRKMAEVKARIEAGL